MTRPDLFPSLSFVLPGITLHQASLKILPLLLAAVLRGLRHKGSARKLAAGNRAQRQGSSGTGHAAAAGTGDDASSLTAQPSGPSGQPAESRRRRKRQIACGGRRNGYRCGCAASASSSSDGVGATRL